MPTFKLTAAQSLKLSADTVEAHLSSIQFRNSTIDQTVFRNSIFAVTGIEFTSTQLLAVRAELITRGIIEMVTS